MTYRGLIQDQNVRGREHSPRQGDKLPLALGEVRAWRSCGQYNKFSKLVVRVSPSVVTQGKEATVKMQSRVRMNGRI